MRQEPFILSKDCPQFPRAASIKSLLGALLSVPLSIVILAGLVIPSIALAVSPFSLDQTLSFQPEPSPSPAPAPSIPAPVTPQVAEMPPQSVLSGDQLANLKSDVFGANLFTGNFAKQGATQFSPDYAIAIGDNIQVRFWGAFEFDAVLTVDPQGNLFLPHVGPVPVIGVRNQDLQRVVESAVGKVFRANVNSYASLAAAQPVRVFVSGFVRRPGLYSGTSMDSVLHYLDIAGGIDPERGSFLDVQVKRGNQTRSSISLYEFLLEGRMPLIQLADGDVIFVAPRQNTLKVTGLAENSKRFEFDNNVRTVADLIKIAKPSALATHVRIVRNTGTVRNTEYYPLADADQITLQSGDELEFTADKRNGTITVRVEGEHDGVQEYVLPDGVRLGEIVKKIHFNERADVASLQLFRLSVKERQREMLQSSLRSLEASALTARSGTSEEARLRKDEADMVLQWVERAKKIEPSGQVLIAQSANRDDLLLENGDVLRIPSKDGLVLVSGEVLFPNTIAYEDSLRLNGYIKRAGGYTQSADVTRIVIAHRDGSFVDAGEGGYGEAIRAGDEILVLPKIETKSRQFWKEMTQIIYQIVVSARIVTRF